MSGARNVPAAHRALAEPKTLPDGPLVARKAVLPHIASDALAQLRRLHPGNKVVTTLEHAIRVEGLTPQGAAVRWWARETPAAP